MTRIEIARSVKPREVLYNRSALARRTTALVRAQASRAAGTWQDTTFATPNLFLRVVGLVATWIARIVHVNKGRQRIRRHGRSISAEEIVQGVLFQAGSPSAQDVLSGHGEKVRAADQLTLDELDDAVTLLMELKESGVARLSKQQFGPDQREVFFSEVHGWESPLPMLRAIWSDRERVVVFYVSNLASSFHHWAVVYQPSLADLLDRYGDDLVVIAPAIVRLTPHLLDVLEAERRRIWGGSGSRR